MVTVQLDSNFLILQTYDGQKFLIEQKPTEIGVNLIVTVWKRSENAFDNGTYAFADVEKNEDGRDVKFTIKVDKEMK